MNKCHFGVTHHIEGDGMLIHCNTPLPAKILNRDLKYRDMQYRATLGFSLKISECHLAPYN